MLEMNRPSPTALSNQLQGGASLLEVLVALVVLSVGVLGIFALHTRSMLESRAVFQETLATLHAQDAAELLWLLPCFSEASADSVLATWQRHTAAQTTLPNWQSSHQWLTTSNGTARLVIHQQWAQRASNLSLTFSVINTPCTA